MYKKLVGVKVKLEDIPMEEIEAMLEKDFKVFNRCEFKITSDILFSEKMKLVMKISEEKMKGKYSLHLPKDILYNKAMYFDFLRLVKELNYIKSETIVNLITHIRFSHFKEAYQRICVLSKILPESYVLLLENEKVDKNNYNYLFQIDKIFNLLLQNNIKNVGLCLDFGHLFFGFAIEGITQNKVIIYLEKMKNILKNIREFHIHDFLEKDHLELGTGIMDFEEIFEFIVRKKLFFPIIIEASVNFTKFNQIKEVLLIDRIIKRIVNLNNF